MHRVQFSLEVTLEDEVKDEVKGGDTANESTDAPTPSIYNSRVLASNDVLLRIVLPSNFLEKIHKPL